MEAHSALVPCHTDRLTAVLPRCTTTHVVRRPPRRKPRATGTYDSNDGLSAPAPALVATTIPQSAGSSSSNTIYSPLPFVPTAPISSMRGPSLTISTRLTFDVRDLPVSLVDSLVASQGVSSPEFHAD